MEALTRMMRTGRRKNSSDNQYSVTVSVANVDGMEQGWKVDMNLQHIGGQKGTCMKIKRHSGY